MNQSELISSLSDFHNWRPITEVAREFDTLTEAQIRYLVQHRDQNGFSAICRKMGNRMFICVPLLGAYTAGLLEEAASQ